MTTEIAVPAQISPMSILQSAVSQGAGIDTIERLAKLQREMLEYDAKVQFEASMQRTQAAMRRVERDMTNPQTKSKYSSYAALDRALRPLYTKEGMSVSFNTGEASEGMVRVLAYVSHAGHTREYQIDMPADGKGAAGGNVMSRTHATGAAASYGMRYLLKMIFNVAVGEDDDDGNGAGKMSNGDVSDMLENIANARHLEELKRIYDSAYEEAKKIGDRNAMATIVAAKDKRKAEL